MNAELQRVLAKEAGEAPGKDGTWGELYDHHLGMVETPLLFGQFKISYVRLTALLASDPDGKHRTLDRQITELSNRLGF